MEQIKVNGVPINSLLGTPNSSLKIQKTKRPNIFRVTGNIINDKDKFDLYIKAENEQEIETMVDIAITAGVTLESVLYNFNMKYKQVT